MRLTRTAAAAPVPGLVAVLLAWLPLQPARRQLLLLATRMPVLVWWHPRQPPPLVRAEAALEPRQRRRSCSVRSAALAPNSAELLVGGLIAAFYMVAAATKRPFVSRFDNNL